MRYFKRHYAKHSDWVSSTCQQIEQIYEDYIMDYWENNTIFDHRFGRSVEIEKPEILFSNLHKNSDLQKIGALCKASFSIIR